MLHTQKFGNFNKLMSSRTLKKAHDTKHALFIHL